MSGTAFGTIVLHVTPDAASGGPLGLVRNGDRIRLSVQGAPHRSRASTMRNSSAAPPPPSRRPRHRRAATPGCMPQEILGADQGCDFAFLKPR